jgi:hypothetical protein
MSAPEGGSAGEKARALRQMAAEARSKADRIDAMASNWEAGEAGERRVAEALRPLVGAHCHVLHDRLLDPGRSRVNLDHIVVSVAGTYLIDAKNWSGHVTGSPAGITLTAAGRTRSMNDLVDKVRHMAEQMELTATTVIEPMLCLAGDEAALFGEAQAIRGVFIVPVDRLADWLISRPRPAVSADLRSRTIKIAATFPSATQPALLSMPRRKRGGANGTVPRSAISAPRTRASGKPTGRRRRAERAAKPVLALAALLLMISPFGMRLIIAGSSLASRTLVHQITSARPNSASTPWTPPCTGVSDAVVAKAVGHPAHSYQNGLHDTCTWTYSTHATGLDTTTITITTGWGAKYGYPNIRTTAAYIHATNSETLVVPQFAAVPGSSAPALRTTQPIAITVSWPGAEREPAGTKQAVTLLASETAAHLPQGPGSTSLTHR